MPFDLAMMHNAVAGLATEIEYLFIMDACFVGLHIGCQMSSSTVSEPSEVDSRGKSKEQMSRREAAPRESRLSYTIFEKLVSEARRNVHNPRWLLHTLQVLGVDE